jgi:hypothetical protein
MEEKGRGEVRQNYKYALLTIYGSLVAIYGHIAMEMEGV